MNTTSRTTNPLIIFIVLGIPFVVYTYLVPTIRDAAGYFYCFVQLLCFFIGTQGRKIQGLNRLIVLLFGITLPFRLEHIVTLAMPAGLAGYTERSFSVTINDIFIFYIAGMVMMRKSYYKTKLSPWALLFVLANFATIFSNTNQLVEMTGLLRIWKCFIIMWFVVSDDEGHTLSLIKGVFIGAAFQFLLGTLQFLTGGALGLTFIGESELGMRTRVTAGALTKGISGTFAHSGIMSVYVLAVLSFVLGTSDNRKSKFFYVASCFIAVILTGSRTSLLISVFVLLIWLLNQGVGVGKISEAAFTWWCVVIFGVLCITLFSNDLLAVFTQSDIGRQVDNRLSFVEYAVTFLSENWITGHGINSYTDYAYLRFGDLALNDFYYSAPIHNAYLTMWFDLGIVGFVSFIVLNLSSLFKTRNNYDTETMPRYPDDVVYYSSGAKYYILAYMVYSLTDYGCICNVPFYLWWIALGIIMKKSNISTTS